MKSKTSCFNKTIFKKNGTRFWPIWALYLIILFFSMPVSLFLRTRTENTSANDINLATEKLESMLGCISSNLTPLVVFVFAILCAIAVFSYLYNARSCNMIHALPVKRSELFVTNYISGILFLIIPQIITFLLCLFVCVINNVTSVEYLLYWLLYTVGMSFFFYSAAVFCCMLTGHFLAGFACYVLANTVYAILKYLFASLFSTLCYGMMGIIRDFPLPATRDMVLSPVVFLDNKVNISWEYDENTFDIINILLDGGGTIAIYLIPGIILIILAALFYQKRQLECAGDIVSFLWMKPIFRWLIAFCAGTGLAMFFTQLFFFDTRYASAVLILCAIPLSCICFFVAEMLLRKQFKVFRKKGWIEWGICACVTLFILCAIDGDLFRLEKKIPDVDEVSAAMIDCNYDIVLTDPEDIKQLEDIHRTIIESKNAYENYYYDHMLPGSSTQSSNEAAASISEDAEEIPENTGETTEVENRGSSISYVSVSYYLKNGRVITRNYDIPSDRTYLNTADSAAAKIRELQNDSDSYLKYLICDNYEDISFRSGTFSCFEDDLKDISHELTAEETQVLYDAIKKDLSSGNYPYGIGNDNINDGNTYYNDICFEGKIDGPFISIYDVLPAEEGTQLREMSGSSYTSTTSGKTATTVYPSFTITDTCQYTIQALIDLGIIRDQSDLTYMEDYYNLLDEMYQ